MEGTAGGGVAGAGMGSEGDPGTVVPELARQHPSVELVELHQLEQVAEARVTLVQAVELLALILHLLKHTHTHTQSQGHTQSVSLHRLFNPPHQAAMFI